MCVTLSTGNVVVVLRSEFINSILFLDYINNNLVDFIHTCNGKYIYTLLVMVKQVFDLDCPHVLITSIKMLLVSTNEMYYVSVNK